MILEIQHETRFEYSLPVKEAVSEIRMEPVSDEDQSCHSFHLALAPVAEVFRYLDGFGNRVHHFNLLGTHEAVRILAAGVVETHRRKLDLSLSQARYPLDLANAPLDVFSYLRLGGPVRSTPLLQPLLETLRPREGMRVVELIQRVSAHIKQHFEYAPDTTLATSPIEDLLRLGKGVCQDFTHLMLALLRSYGVPARYVSGYLHRADKESQTHAWCEAWVPELGWVGLDPTNDCLVHDQFVQVAVGRDFTDVPPNKGIYRGQAQESILARVETRGLERLPSLSWREQLPPLHVPLTSILPPRSQHQENGDMQQQQ